MFGKHGILLAISAALLGCGGRAWLETDAGEEPVLPPGAAPPVEDCAPPLLVPRGRAWVGGMHWEGGKLVPTECNTPGDFVGFRVVVPSFFLDPDEATGACYRHCVDAGACFPPKPVTSVPDAPPWDDESMRLVPAQLLDPAMADAFCAWRGGRVPSLAELGRAEHGAAVAVVNPALTALWLECATEPKPEECGQIYDRVYSFPSPIRSWELDRGPFGHYDLAASAVEVTMTSFPSTQDEEAALCSLPMDSLDPRTLGTGSRVGFETAGNLLTAPKEGEHVFWVILGEVEGGVRCAYDPQ